MTGIQRQPASTGKSGQEYEIAEQPKEMIMPTLYLQWFNENGSFVGCPILCHDAESAEAEMETQRGFRHIIASKERLVALGVSPDDFPGDDE